MKRITRNRRLTPEEAAKYKTIREQVAQELPDMIARHHERMATLDQLQGLLMQLKVAREAKGLSLADVTELTGMDRSAALEARNWATCQSYRRNSSTLRRGSRQTRRSFAHRCVRR